MYKEVRFVTLPFLLLLNFCQALQRQYTENSKHIFPEMKLRGLSPDSYIYVSVSDLYISTIVSPILLQENRLTLLGLIIRELWLVI